MRVSGATCPATSCTLPAAGMPVPMSMDWRIPASPARNRTARRRNARLARGVAHFRRGPQYPADSFPVGGVVVLAAEIRVVHPGGMRPARVDLRGSETVLHRFLSRTP